jgi:DDE superfamily endonuclease
LLIEHHHIVLKSQERSLAEKKDSIKLEYFPVGSAEFNAVEECWRQGKYNILSCYDDTFDSLKEVISSYYRTKKFNLNIVQYLTRRID